MNSRLRSGDMLQGVVSLNDEKLNYLKEQTLRKNKKRSGKTGPVTQEKINNSISESKSDSNKVLAVRRYCRSNVDMDADDQ